MKELQVEIFLEEDTDEETLSIPQDIQEKTLAAIRDIESKLNITMQRSQDPSSLKGRIPFHRLSEQERRMWYAVCPHRSELDRYEGHIPLRVLETLKVAVEKEMFEEYLIYSEFSDKVDPILIGMVDESGEGKTYGRTPFLIARWGVSLFSLSELEKRAIIATEKWFEQKAKKVKAIADSVLASTESCAIAFLEDGSSPGYASMTTPDRI